MPRRTLFDRLVDDNHVAEEMDPRQTAGGLLPQEAVAVQGAVGRRIEHFTAGRLCARRALARLGVEPEVPVPQGEDRTPVWPEGFVGSISHTTLWCAAVVARASEVRSLGIDLESSAPLKPSVLARISTPTERAWIARARDSGLMGKIVFCAKESIYKCQYPLTRVKLGFRGVSLKVGEGSFVAAFTQAAGEFREGDTIEGRYLVEDGLVATACSLGVR